MAVPPPPHPLPPNDGSDVFRRLVDPKSKRPKPGDPTPDEPTDLTEVDPESVPLDVLPTAAPLPPDDVELVVDEILFDDEPHGSITLPGSSALSDPAVLPTGTGSGWLDPPAGGPIEGGAKLLSDLDSTDWQDQQATARADDSELLRAFRNYDQATPGGPLSDSEDGASTRLPDSFTPSSGVHLTPGGDPVHEAPSSIFLPAVTPPPRGGNLPASDASDDGAGMADLFVDPGAGGSSIFERSKIGPFRSDDSDPGGEAIGFDLPNPEDPTGLSQASARIDLSRPDLMDFLEQPDSDDLADLPEPTPVKAAVPAAAAGLAAGAVVATRKSGDVKAVPSNPPGGRADDDDTDDEEPKSRLSAGLGKFAGGAAFGTLASAVTFAALYLFGVIPNGEKKDAAQAVPKPAAVTAADPDAQAKLAELTDKLAAAEQRATAAVGEVTQWKKAAETADINLKMAKEDLAKAGDPAAMEAAKKEALTAKADLETARKEATTLKTDLEAAKKLAGDQAKLATAAVDEAKAAAQKLKVADDTLAGITTELKAAQLLDDKGTVDQLPAAVKKLTTIATSGDAKKAAEALLVAQKDIDKLKTDLKAAGDETVQAKKTAADATAAAEKAKADADKLLTAAKTEADQQIADAKKGTEEKVKAAVTEATKDAQKRLDESATAMKKVSDDAAAMVKKVSDDAAAMVKKTTDDAAIAVRAAKAEADTAKQTAKAEAEAAAKAKIDAAVAKATELEQARLTDTRKFEQRLADLTAQHAAKLADAQSGIVRPAAAVETAALDKAAKAYADGMTAFLAGRSFDAEGQFVTATTANPADARYWYFLGFARYQQGRATEAAAAFRKGGELEARGKPGTKAVGESLERVPIALRRLLTEYRP